MIQYMGKIILENLRYHAPIGWYPEEQLTGNQFTVSVLFSTNFALAANSDALDDTVNYEEVERIISEEMAVPRKLIERTGNTILQRFAAELPNMQSVQVRITKHHPFPTQPGDVTLVFGGS